MRKSQPRSRRAAQQVFYPIGVAAQALSVVVALAELPLAEVA